jgi:hypothetical protein
LEIRLKWKILTIYKEFLLSGNIGVLNIIISRILAFGNKIKETDLRHLRRN